jgi:dCMP deaminase
MIRPDRAEMMMGIARAVSLRGTCDRLWVGAAIARDSRVISTGYNGNVSGQPHCRHKELPDNTQCDSAVHAEANAIVFAARHGVAVEGAELWSTHQPCLSCAKLIINAGIVKVFYEKPYRLREGLEMLIRSNVEVFRIQEDYSAFQVTR